MSSRSEIITFDQFQAEFFRLMSEQQYTQAQELSRQYLPQFPEQSNFLYNWRMCAAALDGDKQLALNTFEESLKHGYWWSEPTLREDADLATLQGDPQFETLMKRNTELAAQATAGARPRRLVFAPEALAIISETPKEPAPLLLFFHGRHSTAARWVPYWNGLAEQGWVVALAQSSQIIAYEGYGWDDWDLAIEEAKAHYLALKTEYNLDPQRIVLAGFSQGGGLCIDLALSGTIPCAGFIGVAPYLRRLEDVEQKIAGRPVPPLRGYLVTGAQDNDQGLFDRLENVLSANQIPFQRENHTDLGHAFPADFATSLQSALAFILPK